MSSSPTPKDTSTAQSFTVELEIHFDALITLSQWIESVAQQAALSKELSFKLNLILEEAVTNIIQHGLQRENPKGNQEPITVSMYCEPDQICLEVIDHGIPFNPLQDHEVQLPESLQDAKIGGLGIHLIKSYAQTLAYRREGDRNILTMTLLRD